ncbi:MAG: Uracil DNA glycosylase superfamily protein [Candidatus Methanolliviera sp. GoM_oil]|nr:MAG: Uracil DNA glycosylase superfamily protein [Candidatus Methanolliviera sp. GoM_oil]
MRVEDLNDEIRRCNRCRLSKTRMNAICGEGNLNSKLMLIAQAPGENEDIEGKMFIGPSGKVLDELLEMSHIAREDIYMTNLIKCMLPKYRRPKQDEVEICSMYLDKEIELIDPKILAPLGYYATKYIFEKYSIALPPSKIDFYKVFGKILFADHRKIFPLPHPAAVLYKPIIKEGMVKNYCKLKVLLTDCKWYPACPMKRFHEEGKLNEEWIELYCKGDWESCVRYKMEERGELHSDLMLPDGSINKDLEKLYRDTIR